MNTAEYSSELATKYSCFRKDFNETDNDLFNVVALIAIKDRDILDLGCGDGRYAMHLKELGARSVEGIDISEKMIEIAFQNKEKTSGVDFHVADGRKLPFKDHTFDIIFSNFVIHYFENTSEVFKEIGRVLRPGGYFIGTFNVTDVSPGFERLYNTNMPIRLGKGDSSIVVQNLIKSRDEISRALSENNLMILSEKEIEHPNAVIDPSFKDYLRVKKHVMCVLIQKQ
ncbi:MAG: hypothetical protein JWO73_59 [Candidatus Taylorbacteria bacterium]|nr:hypothetical protein [Candidatus Taylorbacteria bacterium]